MLLSLLVNIGWKTTYRYGMRHNNWQLSFYMAEKGCTGTGFYAWVAWEFAWYTKRTQ